MELREKVIKHIVDCVNAVDGLTNVQWVLVELDVLKDALALLKAQEPVEPTLRGGIGGYWYCGACNYQISRGDKFCRYCGQEVKWG